MLPGLSNHSSMDVKPETIELFQRDGFVAVSAFYDSEELASIEAELDRFKRERIPELESTEVYYEEKGDASSLKQIQRMQKHDEDMLRVALAATAVANASNGAQQPGPAEAYEAALADVSPRAQHLVLVLQRGKIRGLRPVRQGLRPL